MCGGLRHTSWVGDLYRPEVLFPVVVDNRVSQSIVGLANAFLQHLSDQNVTPAPAGVSMVT